VVSKRKSSVEVAIRVERHSLSAVVVTLLVLQLVLVLWRDPYFGNMDDAEFMREAQSYDPFALARYYDGFGDSLIPERGFYRHSSFVLLNYLYLFGRRIGPLALHLGNSAIVILTVVLVAESARRFSRTNSRSMSAIFVAAFFSWPYSAELFMFPSLQQKVILLGVAAVVGSLSLFRIRHANLLACFFLFASIFFAFGTKTQVVLFVPAIVYLIWILWWRGRMALLPTLFFIVMTIFLASVVAFAALQGSYTSGTREGSKDYAIAPFSDPRFGVLCLVVGGLGVSNLLRLRERQTTGGAVKVETEVALSDTERAFFLVGITYLLAFFVWSMRNYYLALVGVSFAFLVCAIVLRRSVRFRTLGFVSLLLFSCFNIVSRVIPAYDSYYSIREFLLSEEAREISESGGLVVLHQLEAGVRFREYASMLGAPIVDFVTAQSARGQCGGQRAVFLMGDEIMSSLTDAQEDWGSELGVKVWDSKRYFGYEVWSTAPADVC